MKREMAVLTVAVALVGTMAAQATAQVVMSAISRGGNNLVNVQATAGSWVEPNMGSSTNYSGECVIGLVHGYEVAGTVAFQTAAQNGGNFILSDAGYSVSAHSYAYGPYGSGAYALERLSEINSNPASNSWRTALSDYYAYLRGGAGGTAGALSYYSTKDVTSATYDLARYTVAAYYVNATDKLMYRDALVNELSKLDDSATGPVTALGVAVWALAKTNSLDTTAISTDSNSPFYGMKLSDLPSFLAAQYVGDGSFYSKFDHNAGSGCTETTAMGTLAMLALSPSTYAGQISAARGRLANGVDSNGYTRWMIGNTNYDWNFYTTGETLEVLPEPATLFSLALGGLIMMRRRNRQARNAAGRLA